MLSRGSLRSAKHQQGLVLLILVVLVVLALTSYMLSGISVTKIKADNEQSTQANLNKAKQAVIEYAVTYVDRAAGNDYGVLPNPEVSLNSGNDGNMEPTMGAKNVNVIGWLPWRSLDISNLKDDSGTCLYYAVSGSYKNSTRADMINEDSIGKFRIRDGAGNIVQGNTVDEQVVALVFAPGAALPGQVRNPTVINSSCGRDYGNDTAYLEGNGTYDNGTLFGGADNVDDFIHATASSSTEATPYNDKFLTITRDEIWAPIMQRSDIVQKLENLAKGLAMCLANYANQADNASRRLPWPARTDIGGADYRVSSNYDDDNNAAGGYAGRFPYHVDDSNSAINPTIGTDNLFDITGLCDSIDIGGGVTVDLKTNPSEYRNLWENWKDHYFYALSKRYEPDNSGEQECSGGPCIQVNSIDYAAAVIFSGARLAGVTRNDKSAVTEYLEDGKATVFTNESTTPAGNGGYTYTDPQTASENDIMYCIEDQPTGNALTVIECS